MTRTPPLKSKVRTRSSLQVSSAPPLPTATADDAGRREISKGEGGKSSASGEKPSRDDVEVAGKAVLVSTDDGEIGEKSTPDATPDGKGVTKDKGVGKLDSSAYTPFGSMTSMSRSSSDTSETSSESAICQGGPGKEVCGNQVTNDDKAVQCDSCKAWFHIICQEIPRAAHAALVKYKCLSWFCKMCSERMKGKGGEQSQPSVSESDTLKRIEAEVHDVAVSVRNHMRVIVQSIKEQEKTTVDNTHLLERVCRDQNKQKDLYADIVRGTCDKVVKEVGEKIDTIPTQASTGSKGLSETTNAMSRVFDSFIDKERRKLNVVVHNLPEQDGSTVSERMEKDQLLFKEVIKEGMNLIIKPTKAFRVGKKVDDRPRLLIVTLDSTDTKAEVLKMAPQLRHLSEWKKIFVTPDLSKKEREEGKRLREELAIRRQAGEENLIIRKGKIIQATHQGQSDPRPHAHVASRPTVDQGSTHAEHTSMPSNPLPRQAQGEAPRDPTARD